MVFTVCHAPSLHCLPTPLPLSPNPPALQHAKTVFWWTSTIDKFRSSFSKARVHFCWTSTYPATDLIELFVAVLVVVLWCFNQLLVLCLSWQIPQETEVTWAEVLRERKGEREGEGQLWWDFKFKLCRTLFMAKLSESQVAALLLYLPYLSMYVCVCVFAMSICAASHWHFRLLGSSVAHK